MKAKCEKEGKTFKASDYERNDPKKPLEPKVEKKSPKKQEKAKDV